MMMRFLIAFAAMCAMSACATQRYGRASGITSAEAAEYTCRDLKIEMAKSSAFVDEIQAERSRINGNHVLGFFGDFGIGNHLEGNEAEDSARRRSSQLGQLAYQKGCYERPFAAR